MTLKWLELGDLKFWPLTFSLLQGGKFNSGGKHSLLKHAKSLEHKRIVDGQKDRLPGQRSLAAGTQNVCYSPTTW